MSIRETPPPPQQQLTAKTTFSNSSSLTTTTSSTSALTPRANIFILVNLGCEMLYVIDQRLKAQQITAEKSIQVIHDVTTVLLEPKFIDSLIIGSMHTNAELLTVEQCKFMLNDIATCSLMRLDAVSMDKLWNLMTMVYKWQLYLSRHQHHLLDITFRHLDAINRLYPDAKRHMLIDFTKNSLLDFWNACGEPQQQSIYHTNKAWLTCFNTKISLLIRLGFQANDGSFLRPMMAKYYQDFVQTIGDNVYAKGAELKEQQTCTPHTTTSTSTANQMVQLVDLLNITTTTNGSSNSNAIPAAVGEDLQPIDAKRFQQQFEHNLQQCNILFEDFDVNFAGMRTGASSVGSDKCTKPVGCSSGNLFKEESKINSEFVQLQTTYNRHAETSSEPLVGVDLGGEIGEQRCVNVRWMN